MSKIFARSVWIPVAALLLAACAAGRGGAREGPAAPAMEVTVENNLVPGRAVSVRLVSSDGIRRRLGEVRPRRTQTLSADESFLPGSYQLVAETSTGTDLVSRPINLFPGAQVEWDLRNNTVTVSGSP